MYTIAEIGLSHNGSADRAMELIRAAHESGADAVKFQIYDPADIWTSPRDIESRRALQLPASQYIGLAREVQSYGMDAGASLFGQYGWSAVEVLDFLKIAGRTFPEGQEMFSDATVPVYASCRRYLPVEGPRPGWRYLACSGYGPDYRFPLQALAYLRAWNMGSPFGYSSHSPAHTRWADCLEAAHMGASIIEKHFCLKRAGIQYDVEHSLEPDEFAAMARELKG